MGGRLLVSISVGREGGATDDRFFFFSPHPSRPRETTIPSPSPSHKEGGRLEGETRVGRGGDLAAAGSADPWRRGPGVGGARGSRASPPPHTHTRALTAGSLGSPRGSSGVWRTLGQRWGKLYESNLRPSGPELPVRFTERLRLPCFPLALRCVAFGDPIFVAETTI